MAGANKAGKPDILVVATRLTEKGMVLAHFFLMANQVLSAISKKAMTTPGIRPAASALPTETLAIVAYMIRRILGGIITASVEEAIVAAYADDYGPFDRLVEVLAAPYDERAGLKHYAEPPRPEQIVRRTSCGT